MKNADRTTKILLGMIALLLAAIAAQPLWEGREMAYAQAGSGTGTVTKILRTELVNRVNFRDAIQGVEVMDSKGIFIVHTANMVEVYRVDNLPETTK